MCKKKCSDYITFRSCCFGLPLKNGTLIAGALLLIFCTYTEMDGIQAVFMWNTEEINYLERTLNYSGPVLTAGSGLSIVDQAIRHQGGLEQGVEFVVSYIRALYIAWAVINGLLIISTCFMMYGTAKERRMFLLQWLVLSVPITVGNFIDIILGMIHLFDKTRYGHRYLEEHWELLRCVLESGLTVATFLTVRSYYCRLSLPSTPVSFKLLEGRDLQEEEQEN